MVRNRLFYTVFGLVVAGLNWAALNTGELVVTNDATDIVLTDAALARYGAVLQGFINVNGNLTLTGDIRGVTVIHRFEYGVKGDTAPRRFTQDIIFAGNNVSKPDVLDKVFDLLCGTTYTFRLIGTVDSTGQVSAGQYLEFTTPPCTAVTVVDERLASVGVRDFSFSSTINLYGLAATLYVEYGTVGNTGIFINSSKTPDIVVEAGVGVKNINVPVAGLTCNTTLGARTVVKIPGKADVNGGGFQFTTKPCPPPPVVTFSAANIQRITANSALFTAMVVPNYSSVSTSFEYRKAGDLVWIAAPKNITVVAGAETVAQRVVYHVGTLDCALQYEVTFLARTEFGDVASVLIPFKTGDCGGTTGLTREQTVGRLAAGGSHALLVRSDNSITAWGDNSFGQLGSNAQTWWVGEVLAADGKPIEGVTQVSAGFAFSAATAETTETTDAKAIKLAKVYSWGANAQGQLGSASNKINDGTPRAVMYEPLPGDNNCIADELCNVGGVVNGVTHALAYTLDGKLYSWGDNAAGQLGDGSLSGYNAAQQVFGFKIRVAGVAAGASFSLARMSDGTVQAFGANNLGQLGDASTQARAEPGVVGGGSLGSVVAISAGWSHALALLDNTSVMAWGANDKGQLGVIRSTASEMFKTQPAPVIDDQGYNLTTVVAVAAGGAHSIALLANGTVVAWGENTFGQLGDGTNLTRSIPQAVMVSADEQLVSVVAIAAGDDFSLALVADGTLYGWGNNSRSQLGGSAGDKNYASAVMGPLEPLNYFTRKLVLSDHMLKLGGGKNTATFSVALAQPPVGTLNVSALIMGSVVKISGANTLQFNASNWDKAQNFAVILDNFNGVATDTSLRLSAAGYDEFYLPITIAGVAADPVRAPSTASGAWGYEVFVLILLCGIWGVARVRAQNSARKAE
ncbi:MAG: hypothetical protein AABY83_07365 [Pseudomonadota bacterium]